MSRNGGGAVFNLSYNSQNWRQDAPPGGPVTTWQFGRDAGYGYGWKLQAGSLTPIYQDYFTIHHWQFIDATGAEYRLDNALTDSTNQHVVYTSTEGIYLFYDATVAKLYFKDGSSWIFGSVSAGTEQDAGTRYPTLMQDRNGNQIKLSYNIGAGVSWQNSCSRLDVVKDVRAVQGSPNETTALGIRHWNQASSNFLGVYFG